MFSIEKAQNILLEKDVIFLMASREGAVEINAFRNTHGYKFNYTRIENSEELGIQALPKTYSYITILDGDGYFWKWRYF